MTIKASYREAKKGKLTYRHTSITDHLYQEVEDSAEKKGISKSQLMRQSLVVALSDEKWISFVKNLPPRKCILDGPIIHRCTLALPTQIAKNLDYLIKANTLPIGQVIALAVDWCINRECPVNYTGEVMSTMYIS